MTDSTKQGGLLPTRCRPGIDSNFSQRGCIGIRDVEIKSIPASALPASFPRIEGWLPREKNGVGYNVTRIR